MMDEFADSRDETDAALRMALLARAACWPRGALIRRDLLLASLELPASDPLAADRASAVLEQMLGAELRPAGSRGVRLFSARAGLHQLSGILDEARGAVERTLVAAAEQALAEGNVRRLRPWAPDLRAFADRALADGRRDLLAIALARGVGAVNERLGDLDAARRYLDLAFDRCDADSDADATVRANLLQRLAGVAWKQHEEPVAASYAGLAVDLLSTMLGERHLLTAAAQLLHSRLRLARDDFAGAQEQLEAALATRQALLAPGDPQIAEAHLVLGDLYARSGNAGLALGELRTALALYDAAPHQRRGVAQSAARLAAVLAQVGDMEGAVHHARTALEARAAANIGDDAEAAEVLRILGRGCIALGDLASGRAAFGRALEVLLTVYGPEAPETRELREQIAQLAAGKLLAVPPTWN